MKKEFLLLFAFCNVLAFQLSAQGDFAPIGAKWYYSWATSSDSGDPGRKVGYTKLQSVKDTILINQSCRKVELTTYHKFYNSANAPVDTYRSTLFLYSDADAVYYYESTFNRFIPLYVFNVEVGDTVTYQIPSYLQFASTDTIFRMRISDITTNTVGGVSLKTFYHYPVDGVVGFGLGLDMPYTEKIGVFGDFLICYSTFGISTNFSPTLRCYSDSLVNYIADPNMPCDYFEGISIIEKDNPITSAILGVYPNPTNSVLHIQLGNAKATLEHIQLYEVSGKKVLEQEGGKIESVLNVANLTPGLYILKAIIDNKSITTKVVIR